MSQPLTIHIRSQSQKMPDAVSRSLAVEAATQAKTITESGADPTHDSLKPRVYEFHHWAPERANTQWRNRHSSPKYISPSLLESNLLLGAQRSKSNPPDIKSWARSVRPVLFGSLNYEEHDEVSECYTPADVNPTMASVAVKSGTPSLMSSNHDSHSNSRECYDSASCSDSVIEQMRSGPFGDIFDGLRLTDTEREYLEELLEANTGSSQAKRQKAPTAAEIVETVSQITYFDFIRQGSN